MPPRTRWRPGRRSAVAVVGVGPWVGAAVGAGLSAQTRGERAESLVVIGGGAGPVDRTTSRSALVRTGVALARAPATAQAARALVAGLGPPFPQSRDVGGTGKGSGDPAGGGVRIDGSAPGRTA